MKSLTKRGIIAFGLLIILLAIEFSLGYSAQDRERIIEENVDNSLVLYNLIKPIMDNTIIENGDCLDYALYYKPLLNKLYPELDIRKIDFAGICPIGTKECGDDEGIPHTYLIINGHGGECILDQHLLACNQVRGEK